MTKMGRGSAQTELPHGYYSLHSISLPPHPRLPLLSNSNRTTIWTSCFSPWIFWFLTSHPTKSINQRPHLCTKQFSTRGQLYPSLAHNKKIFFLFHLRQQSFLYCFIFFFFLVPYLTHGPLSKYLKSSDNIEPTNHNVKSGRKVVGASSQ